MAWDRDGDNELLPYESRVTMANEVGAADSWVVEGIYLGWTAPLMNRADVIVWMDVPVRVALWRIFCRHLKAELRRDNKFPGWRRLFRFMRLANDQYRDRSDVFQPPDIPIGPASIARELKPFEPKVLRSSGYRTMQEVLARLEPGQAT